MFMKCEFCKGDVFRIKKGTNLIQCINCGIVSTSSNEVKFIEKSRIQKILERNRKRV